MTSVNSAAIQECAIAQHDKSPLNIQNCKRKSQTASSDDLNYLLNYIAQNKAYKKGKFGKHEQMHTIKLHSAKHTFTQ